MLRHGILGLFNYRDMTGYEIREAFETLYPTATVLFKISHFLSWYLLLNQAKLQVKGGKK